MHDSSLIPTRTITLRPGTVTAAVGLLAGCVAAAGVAGQVMEHRLGVRHSFGFIRSFDLDQEGNLATWFGVALLLLNAMVLGGIALARRGGSGGKAWAGLFLLLLAMSAEEVAALHEMTVLPLRNLLHAGGLLYYTWVVPGAVLVICVVAVYLPFVLRLPARTRNQFFLAGFVYVGGAIGFEMIGGRQADLHGDNTLGYKLIAQAEETLEMAGQIVLLYALLDYVARHIGPVTVHVTGATRVTVHAEERAALSAGEARRSAAVVPTLPLPPPPVSRT